MQASGIPAFFVAFASVQLRFDDAGIRHSSLLCCFCRHPICHQRGRSGVQLPVCQAQAQQEFVSHSLTGGPSEFWLLLCQCCKTLLHVFSSELDVWCNANVSAPAGAFAAFCWQHLQDVQQVSSWEQCAAGFLQAASSTWAILLNAEFLPKHLIYSALSGLIPEAAVK